LIERLVGVFVSRDRVISEVLKQQVLMAVPLGQLRWARLNLQDSLADYADLFIDTVLAQLTAPMRFAVAGGL